MLGRLDNGRDCFVVETSAPPSSDPERSMRVLELLVRGFDAIRLRGLCNRGYFSPDIVTTYSVQVIIEGDDQ